MPPIENLDVVLCTYNSNKPYFQRCLQSIKNEVPIHCLIVVDKFSKDGTIDLIKNMFPNAIVVESSNNLALARKAGIQKVDTKYFAFVDDDVELPKGWLERLRKNMKGNVGAIHELPFPAEPSVITIWKWQLWLGKWFIRRRGFTSKAILDVDKYNINKSRGYTHNTVVLTELVKDWEPKDLSAFEDWVMQKHIVEKGFVWRILWNYSVKHHTPQDMKEYWKRTKWGIANARISGFEQSKLRGILFQSIIQNILALKASLDLRDPRIFSYVVQLRFHHLNGWLKSIQFKDYQRS